MKKMRLLPSAVLTANLLLCAVLSYGQSDTTNAYFGNYGYNATGKLDTVKAVLLITDCDDCQSKSITAFAVREKQSYSGDRMPPGNYDDYWSVKSYLDSKKKAFPSATTIWDCRLK